MSQLYFLFFLFDDNVLFKITIPYWIHTIILYILLEKEWIPHWIHTGHLHIDGLKMSKSLKNFITIRSLLQSESSSQESLFHSPSDDFRLWCLGLSGSYRAPATYSETRLKEAKVSLDQKED